MKKTISMVCVICLLFNLAPVWAEEAWTAEAWDQTVMALVSADPMPVPPSRRIRIRPDQVYLSDPGEQRSEWMNIALISSDSPDMHQNFGRSEALLVCRLNTRTGAFYLLSLPEYMKVTLAGCPDEVQLKHVNCFGGPLLVLDAVNRELGLSVNRYCAINVDSFAGIINTFGGVAITLTEEEAEEMGIGPGEQTLTGEQAVMYLKLRREWDGTAHFRILLEAMLHKMSSDGMVSAALILIDGLLHMIDTNLTLDEIATFAFSLMDRQEMKGIASYRLEADAEGHVDDAALQACRDFLYGGAGGK
ncbi:MAG: LCP family protein [Clostridia bacterium]|nr:LCP family protein [Clostridia bacterium]